MIPNSLFSRICLVPFPFVVLFLFIVSPTLSFAEIEGCVEDQKCEAVDLYQDGLSSMSNNDLQGAIRIFDKARTLVPQDSSPLKIIVEKKIIVSSGYRPKTAYVKKTVKHDYQPNSKTRKIRVANPPNAEIVIKALCTGQSLCLGNNSSSSQKLVFKVRNIGQTRYDNLTMKVVTSTGSDVFKYNNLAVGESEEFSKSISGSSEVLITFDETDGLVPADFQFAL